MGALSYGTNDEVQLKKEAVDGRNLVELQRLAARFEEDATAVDNEMALLFQAGSSPGGARPKVLIKDQKTSYLAKFPSVRDQFDVVALEAATMELARQGGVTTFEHHLFVITYSACELLVWVVLSTVWFRWPEALESVNELHTSRPCRCMKSFRRNLFLF